MVVARVKTQGRIMAKTVLIAAYGGGHVNMIIPVIRELEKESDLRVVTLGLTTARLTLEKQGMPFVSYKDLLTDEDGDALEYGKELLAEMGDSGIIPAEESIAYLGLSFKDLCVRHGEDKARQLYEEKNRHAFLPLTIADRVIEKFKPDVVVATNSPKTEKAMILQARKHGIPAVCIIDLFDSTEFNDRLGQEAYADRLCVLTQEVKEMLKKYGRKDSELAVTGNPAFDQLAHLDLKKLGAEYKKKNQLEGKKVILWGKQTFAADMGLYPEIDKLLLNYAESRPGTHILFRPHPNDTTDYGDLPPWASLSKEPASEVPAILQASDLVVSMNSTIVMEAALLQRPVATMEMAESCKACSFASIGASVAVNSMEDFSAVADGILAGDYKAPDLPKAGEAASKVKDEILSFL